MVKCHRSRGQWCHRTCRWLCNIPNVL